MNIALIILLLIFCVLLAVGPIVGSFYFTNQGMTLGDAWRETLDFFLRIPHHPKAIRIWVEGGKRPGVVVLQPLPFGLPKGVELTRNTDPDEYDRIPADDFGEVIYVTRTRREAQGWQPSPEHERALLRTWFDCPVGFRVRGWTLRAKIGECTDIADPRVARTAEVMARTAAELAGAAPAEPVDLSGAIERARKHSRRPRFIQVVFAAYGVGAVITLGIVGYEYLRAVDVGDPAAEETLLMLLLGVLSAGVCLFVFSRMLRKDREREQPAPKVSAARRASLELVRRSWELGLRGVQRLLEEGAEIDTRDELGRTVLMKCIFHKEVVEALLAAGAGLESRDEEGLTPLLHAAKRGAIDVLEDLLLPKGADLTARDARGWTALMHAVHDQEAPGLVELLIERGVALDAEDSRGRTALHLACQGRVNREVVMALVQAGANPHAQDERDRTPLDLLKAGAYLELAELVESTWRP